MATLLSDTFTDTDNVALTSHTMDVGGGWSALGGTCKISSNKATGNSMTGTNGNASVKADASTPDVVVTGDISSTDNGTGLLVRSSSDDVGWLCRNYGGTLELYEMVSAGSYALRASQAGAGTGAHTLTVTASGSSITVAVGATSCNYASATFNASVTTHGMRFAATGDTVDNFLATGEVGQPAVKRMGGIPSGPGPFRSPGVRGW